MNGVPELSDTSVLILIKLRQESYKNIHPFNYEEVLKDKTSNRIEPVTRGQYQS